MSQSPLVSVLIPCYNVSQYVGKAINSILTQSYEKLEVWLIDDASTDDTLLKLKTIKDPRVRVIEFKENTQKIGAVNTVLKEVNGDLITFQDADDWSELDRISEQVKQFSKEPELGICFTNYRYFGAVNQLPQRVALTDDELKEQFFNFRKIKASHFSPTNCPSMMITREVLNSIGGYHGYFKGRVAEDIHWIYRILKEFPGITIDKPLYNYNVRSNSFTGLQSTGENAKYAYSWQLLEKIIHKDFYEGTDVLNTYSEKELLELELIACEEALVENIRASLEMKTNYESSVSYKLGKLLLTPFHILKKELSRFFFKL
jgi:glycosyltransferase involved in cell wall biosynthesis